jgi:hypothetical protein
MLIDIARRREPRRTAERDRAAGTGDWACFVRQFERPDTIES